MPEDANIISLVNTCLDLGQRVGKLEAALKFYAEEANWRSPSEGFALQYDPVIAAIHIDRGAKAREALEGDE